MSKLIIASAGLEALTVVVDVISWEVVVEEDNKSPVYAKGVT